MQQTAQCHAHRLHGVCTVGLCTAACTACSVSTSACYLYVLLYPLQCEYEYVYSQSPLSYAATVD